jgi:predicted CopG family antitoxin
MSATTIKIEDPLLSEIRKIKPEDQSVSSYIKETLEHEIRRKRMSEAAQEYQAFLRENPEEAHSIQDWESAPLQKPARTKKPR